MAINLRPGLKSFLTHISKIFEVIVFTSSDKSYANVVLDLIDPDRSLIHHRLFREHCFLYSESFYIKDLRILNRDLKNVIIIDNAPYAFGYQLENGYPIMSFTNNTRDKELAALTDYLEQLANVEDIREVNREKFKLQWLYTSSGEDFLNYCMDEEEDMHLESASTSFQQTLGSYFNKLD